MGPIMNLLSAAPATIAWLTVVATTAGLTLPMSEVIHTSSIVESHASCLTASTSGQFVAITAPIAAKPRTDPDGGRHRPALGMPQVQLPTDPLSDLCDAIEEGCYKGCVRGANILVRAGLLDEGRVEAYVEECMQKHCDSPCKPGEGGDDDQAS